MCNDGSDEPKSFDDWGLWSAPWVLKAALYWVPRGNLYYSICALVDYLHEEAIKLDSDEGDGPVLEKAFDILFQTATTGQYTEVYDPEDGPPEPKRLSEEEIEAEAQKFREFLNGMREAKEGGGDGD